MAALRVTIIDVGWGDSILIESEDDGGDIRYALVDCNDYEKERSSLLFVKRHFDRRGVDHEERRHNFEWVLLTHGHADHARGMKRMLQTFGTRNFWYPKSNPSTLYGTLLAYSNRSSRVDHHQAVDRTKNLNTSLEFGNVELEALWPNRDQIDDDENNNSVVLALTLGDVSFVLTGDAEAPNWDEIAPRLPATTRVFQHPHHGAENGMFAGGTTPWLDQLDGGVIVALSSHIRPHRHPHPSVITELSSRDFRHLRTDVHYHLTFETDGATVRTKYSDWQ